MSVSFVSCVLFVEIFISFYRLYKMCVFFSSSFLRITTARIWSLSTLPAAKFEHYQHYTVLTEFDRIESILGGAYFKILVEFGIKIS